MSHTFSSSRGLLLLSLAAGACSASAAHQQPTPAPETHTRVSEPEPITGPASWLLPPEFAPAEQIIVGWDPDFEDFYRDVLLAVAPEADVRVVVDPGFDRKTVEALVLEVQNSENTKAHRIDIVDEPIRSIWLRDFGPLVSQRANERRVTDLNYWAKGDDDQLATRLARDWLGMEVMSLPIELEGGNLQTDGTGQCLVSTAVLEANPTMSEQDIRIALSDSFGCVETHLIPPLPGEPTKHVDMFASFTAPGEILVGRYAKGANEDDRLYLEWLSSYLEAHNFHVRRVPMPDQEDGMYRSYTNSLAVNGVVMVPFYLDATADLEEALSVFEEAYPGRIIVPIEASDLISLDGAVHCAAMTIARGPSAPRHQLLSASSPMP